MSRKAKRLQAGIIGVGGVGRAIAQWLAGRNDIGLKCVCDVNWALARRIGRQYACPAFARHTAMLAEALDVVFVCTTNAAHADCVVAAAEAGVPNIYCEKPLALTLAEAERMVRVTRRKNIRTSMGFGGRLEPYTAQANKLVQSGRLGDILSCWIHGFRGWGFWGSELLPYHHPAVRHPEVSGGWAIHHACHEVFWTMLVGGPVREVYGKCIRSHQTVPGEELVWALLTFANGGAGVISDSLGAFRGTRWGIIGTRGTVLITRNGDHYGSDRLTEIEMRLRYEGRRKDITRRFPPYTGSWADLLNEYLTAIKRDLPSPVTFEQGRDNLQVCLAIQESARTGKVVKL